MSDKNALLKKHLLLFFNKKENVEKLVNVLDKKTRYSLRVLEWFVSNYAKKYNTIITSSGSNGKKIEFNVHLSYRDQLKSYNKIRFDAFKRNEKFTMKTIDDRKIVTTVGQLNIFKWFIENKILEYTNEHLDEIKQDMNKSIISPESSLERKKKEPLVIKRKSASKKKKRQPLSVSATRTVIRRFTDIIITF